MEWYRKEVKIKYTFKIAQTDLQTKGIFETDGAQHLIINHVFDIIHPDDEQLIKIKNKWILDNPINLTKVYGKKFSNKLLDYINNHEPPHRRN